MGLETVNRDGLYAVAEAQSEELGSPLNHFVGTLVLKGERRRKGERLALQELCRGEANPP